MLAMACVTTVQTNAMWNGCRSPFFNPQRGIGQGDPISPYIFVLCMDKLSHLISQKVDSGDWAPLKAGKSGLRLSHLMFADDLLLFGEATNNQMNCMKETLNNFCSMSGQMVSLENTTILFAKCVTHRSRLRLANLLGLRK